MKDTNSIKHLHDQLKKYHGSQAEIARRLGKKKQQVNNVLRGEDSPNQEILAEAITVLEERRAQEAAIIERFENLTTKNQ